MSTGIVVTENEHFPGAVCVQVNFVHDERTARRVFTTEAAGFNPIVNLEIEGRRLAINDMLKAAVYTVTPQVRRQDLKGLAAALANCQRRFPRSTGM